MKDKVEVKVDSEQQQITRTNDLHFFSKKNKKKYQLSEQTTNQRMS